MIAYFGTYKGEEVDTKSQLVEDIKRRSAISKESTIEALADAIDDEAKDACSFETALSLMKL